MDNELFELCKEVYKRTGWDKDGELNAIHKDGSEYMLYAAWRRSEDYAPLYTSDYLLEKLPPTIWVTTSDGTNVVCLLTINMQSSGEATAVYTIPYDEQFRGSYSNRADTPLKALLKLVIALDDAGELK